MKRPEKTGRDYSRAAVAGLALLWLVGTPSSSAAPEKPRPVVHAAVPEKVIGHQALYNYQLSFSQEHDVHLQVWKNNYHKYLFAHPALLAETEVTPLERYEWDKVDICEEKGNWHVVGDKYEGGLGISVYNWYQYGGAFFSKSEAMATPDEQILIGMRIQPNAPDQTICAPW